MRPCGRNCRRSQRQKRGHLSIGANYAANALWLPHILPVFRREYPGISISIFQQSSPLFEKELLKGDIDLAFTTQSAPSKSLSYVYLSSALLVFIPNTSPILRGRDISHNSLDCPLTVSPEELNHQDFVLLHPSDGLGHTISALLEENRIRPSHILYAPNIVACYRLAAAGMGITFATPYSTRYTLPGAVPVIAQLSTGTVYEQNAIAYPKDKQLLDLRGKVHRALKAKSFNASFTSTIIYRSVGFPFALPLQVLRWKAITFRGILWMNFWMLFVNIHLLLALFRFVLCGADSEATLQF